MKIRITDLLDDYLDNDLPLDAMPDILPGDPHKPKKSTRHSARRKRGAQIVAAVLIVASISVAGGLKLWCGSPAGKSLSDQAVPADENPQTVEKAAAEPAEPTPEPTETAATEETSITDGGYTTTTISVDGSGLTVSAGNLRRSGTDYQLDISIDADVENVTGFQLSDMDVDLVLADGTSAMPVGAAESSEPENPFVLREVYSFDQELTEAQLQNATLYLDIRSVLVSTTEESIPYAGQWYIGLSEEGVPVPTEDSLDAPTTLSEGQSFTVTDLTVSESGCTFWLHTDVRDFTLVPQGQLSLAAQQDDQWTYYSFSVLTDGTYGTGTMTIDSASMSTRGVTDTQNLAYYTVTWKETVDPTSITGLYFTDGTTSQTVEVTTDSY